MASLRLRELSEKLDIDLELMSRIWTCFEYCIQNHTELLKDRHLDQIIMCSVYVLAKVTGKNKSFQDIMKFYRLQPQANSHVSMTYSFPGSFISHFFCRKVKSI